MHRIPALVAYAICSDEGHGRVVEAPLLAQAATTLEEIAEHGNVNLVWAPPQERDERVTLADQVRAGPRTTDDACVRVESDGRVLRSLPAEWVLPYFHQRYDDPGAAGIEIG